MTCDLTVVITDAGFGGLSTTADLYNKLQRASRLRRVDLVFFNALADPALGYQAMGSTAQKVAVFQNALQCMYDRYHPDYLLIACNTLSVLHEQTAFTRTGVVPVGGGLTTGAPEVVHSRTCGVEGGTRRALPASLEKGNRERDVFAGVHGTPFTTSRGGATRAPVVHSRTCGVEGGTRRALPVGGATRAPVIVGIVDTSVRQMLEFLRAEPTAAMIIFGTKTTIDSGTYPRRLMAAGIAAERIVPEACATALILAIEQDAAGAEVRALIRTHVAAALARVRREGPIAASLNCTHYGYAEALFREAFAAEGVSLRALLNPNTAMGDFLVADNATSPEAVCPEVSVRVVSQSRIDAPTMGCMTRLIGQIAPAVATALRAYEHDPSLFAWRGVGV